MTDKKCNSLGFWRWFITCLIHHLHFVKHPVFNIKITRHYWNITGAGSQAKSKGNTYSVGPDGQSYCQPVRGAFIFNAGYRLSPWSKRFETDKEVCFGAQVQHAGKHWNFQPYLLAVTKLKLVPKLFTNGWCGGGGRDIGHFGRVGGWDS